MVKLLVEKYSADPNFLRYPPGLFSLWVAASMNQVNVVTYLLENNKADLHLGSGRFASGPTALFVAIQLYREDVITPLLQHGGPVDHVDDEILQVEKPTIVVLLAEAKERAPVSMLTQENAKQYDSQGNLTRFVLLKVDKNDKEWLQKLQWRKTDDELNESGPHGRQLNAAQLRENPPVVNEPPEWPTVEHRVEELCEADDGESSIYWPVTYSLSQIETVLSHISA